jgi:hypothetical protein
MFFCRESFGVLIDMILNRVLDAAVKRLFDEFNYVLGGQCLLHLVG